MLISSADRTLEAIKWKIHHHYNPRKAGQHKETFGFPTTKAAPKPKPDCPSAAPLKEFEDGLLEIIKSIEFDHTTNKFQENLKVDVQKICDDKNVFVSADKTSNFYKMEPTKYKEMLDQNIQKEYKKIEPEEVLKYEKEDVKLAKTLDIEDRVHRTAEREAFITIKDHKDNFQNNPKCRLLNATKPELGKVSKK